MLEDKDLLSIQEVRTKVEKAFAAWQKYRSYSQEQIDAIVERMAAAARANAKSLADLAVEETGYGNAKDKYIKNLLTCDWLPRRMRGMRTVGILRELPEEKIVEIGVPMGVIAAVLPTTNPTSTAIFKTLISLKAGNAIVLSPHPRAFKCTCQTAGIMYQAALEAGAPEDIIQCIDRATMEGINALMRHERVSVILATGGHAMVKSAYSSGKPAFGVGPGNVPVLVDTSADLEDAIAKVVAGKSFDYGTVCSSEQALVAEYSLRDRILSLLQQNKAYLCNGQQTEALGKLLLTPNWTVNPDCVGQAPTKIARMAGFQVPEETSIICCEIEGVGKKYPLSAEKLCPVLSLIFVADFNAALDTCFGLLKFGGAGHTAVIHGKNDTRIREYGLRMPANRVLVNTPAPQGSTGITTNVFPSMTLGCGAMANNSTSDNVGPQHLMNIKRLAYTVRKPEEAFEMPLDYDKASDGPMPSGGGSIGRAAVVSAVERYLASRGMAVSPTGSGASPAASVGAFQAPAATSPVSSCGCSTPGPTPTPTIATNQAQASQLSIKESVVASIAAEVVDRFLSSRGTSPAPMVSASSSSLQSRPGSYSLPAGPDAKTSSTSATPPPKAVDFVCEADVSQAVKEQRKIYVGPKTIVTPSARDLANRSDILRLV